MWPFSTAYPEVRFVDIRDEYDYIIVGKHTTAFIQRLCLHLTFPLLFSGGGTAGCVLANRLSQSPDITVLLVERGPLADSWASRVPLLSSDFASDGSRSQTRVSEYQPEIGRSINLCTGSVLGGTTRINQMIYIRGLEKEYDMWKEETGCKGWGWDDVSPLFKKSENALGGGDANVDQEVHGTTGNFLSEFEGSFLIFPFFVFVGEWCNQDLSDLHFLSFNK